MRLSAHGAEVQFNARPKSRISVNAAYTYTSTQVLKEPLAFDPILSAGRPLIRRPKHSATLLSNYLGHRWGADLAGSFVGRRADSDFFGYNVNHTPGYVLVNAGRLVRHSSTGDGIRERGESAGPLVSGSHGIPGAGNQFPSRDAVSRGRRLERCGLLRVEVRMCMDETSVFSENTGIGAAEFTPR